MMKKINEVAERSENLESQVTHCCAISSPSHIWMLRTWMITEMINDVAERSEHHESSQESDS